MKTFEMFVEEKMSKGDKFSRRRHDAKADDPNPMEEFHVRAGQKVSFVHPNQSSVEPDAHSGRYIRRSKQDPKFLNIDDGTQLWRVHPNNVRKVED